MPTMCPELRGHGAAEAVSKRVHVADDAVEVSYAGVGRPELVTVDDPFISFKLRPYPYCFTFVSEVFNVRGGLRFAHVKAGSLELVAGEHRCKFFEHGFAPRLSSGGRRREVSQRCRRPAPVGDGAVH